MQAYMLVALRRVSKSKNENVGLTQKVIRQLIKPSDDYHLEVEKLVNDISNEDGYWRIYRSVNKRDLNKAFKALQIEMINRGTEIADRIDGVWKSIIMKPENKAERLFLVDIDTKNEKILMDIISSLNPIGIIENNETPNGYHIITKPFKPQLLQNFKDVEVKKDALFFIKDIDNT